MRTLFSAAIAVKRTARLALVAVAFCACGGSGPELRKPDPYGPRIANCIDLPRPLSDQADARMVAIPAGVAVLGSTPAQRRAAAAVYGQGGERAFSREAPARRAHVGAFRMDRTPVTNQAYRELADACGISPPNTGVVSESAWQRLRARFALPFGYAEIRRFLWEDHDPPHERGAHPVVLVTRDEAGMYCAWRGARLPTEDEWERAARGPRGLEYPWGNTYDPYRANSVVRAARDTLPVGSLPQGASPEGVLDLGGHVFEWTASDWPEGKGSAIAKGNGWDGRGGFGRGAARVSFHEQVRSPKLGFRCASDL